ncbi:hypothetical protein [Actibacterium sp. MT2.3-13A]|uniref:hypothetical protein n=1 Tax=Actibacterium sp. MT2.3-13A TaxID=2828332 RepID=UPI001BA74580|nr:hypothetical protein [Actibacterium sp. MT2.3-13A]
MPQVTHLNGRIWLGAGLLALALAAAPARAAERPPPRGAGDGAAGAAGQTVPPAPRAEADGGWTIYTNARFGTSIRPPQSRLRPAGDPPANEEGRRFAPPDGQAEMRVWTGQSALRWTVTQTRTEILNTHPAARPPAQRGGAHRLTFRLDLRATVLLSHGIADGAGGAAAAAPLAPAPVSRARALGRRGIFPVRELPTDGTWCYPEAAPLQPDGSSLDWPTTSCARDRARGMMSDLVMVPMRRQGGGWRVVDNVIGPTDVIWYNWVDGYGLPERLFTPGD